jgi:hypothetical protein
MTKTGPQKYPGASLTYWYGSKYPGDSMESNVVVWHTTEGRTLPSYNGGSEAPNFTALPDFAAKKLRWYQHFDFDTSSRALVNKAGGVETNTLNAVQIELVGTCDPATHQEWAGKEHLYTPNLPTWVIEQLGDFAAWANANHGVPLTSGVTFRPYPSSYGNSPVRMTSAQWEGFKGHCGHQHVPENDHGDPGAFPIAAILSAAKGTDNTGDTTVANPTAKEVWLYKGQDETSDVYAYVRNTKRVADDIDDRVAALTLLAAQQQTTLNALMALLKVVSSKLDA